MADRRPNPRQDRGAGVTTSPTPGLYKTRLVKGGPMLPALIFWSVARDPETGVKMDRPAQLLCLVAGEHVDPWRYWPMHPVSQAEYQRLMDAMPDDVRSPRRLSDEKTLF